MQQNNQDLSGILYIEFVSFGRVYHNTFQNEIALQREVLNVKINLMLKIIVLTIFLDALGFAILIPIVPQLFANPGSNFYILPQEWSVATGYLLLGGILGIFPLMQFFSTAILGQLSDKFGRKIVLMYTIFGTSVSYTLFALGILTRSIPLLFFSRAMAGITTGNLSVAQAVIADITEPKDRAKNFGLMGAAFGFGFIIGPFIGGILSDSSLVSWFNPSIPFWFAASMSLINVVSVYFNLKETNKLKINHPKIHPVKSITNILMIFKLKNLRLLYLTNFLFFSGFTFYVTFISVVLIDRFKFNQSQIGYFFSYTGLWFAFTQAVLTRIVSKYLPEKKVLRFSLLMGGTAVLLIFFTNVWWELLIVAPIIAFANGLSMANITGLISRSSDQSIQGEILGINFSVQALGQLIPPLLSGVIAAAFTPETPLLVSSAIMLISGVVFITFYKGHSVHNPEHTT